MKLMFSVRNIYKSTNGKKGIIIHTCWICNDYARYISDEMPTCRLHMTRGSPTYDGQQTCEDCFDDPKTRGLLKCGENILESCKNPEHIYKLGGISYNKMKTYFDNGDFEKSLPPSEEDIDLVFSQTNASRENIINSLTKHNNDIVDAIMELII